MHLFETPPLRVLTAGCDMVAVVGGSIQQFELVVSEDGGVTFSEPRPLPRGTTSPHWGWPLYEPIVADRDGTLYAGVGEGDNILLYRSDDAGVSWSGPFAVASAEPYHPYQTPTVLARDNEVLVVWMHRQGEKTGIGLARSQDRGEHFVVEPLSTGVAQNAIAIRACNAGRRGTLAAWAECNSSACLVGTPTFGEATAMLAISFGGSLRRTRVAVGDTPHVGCHADGRAMVAWTEANYEMLSEASIWAASISRCGEVSGSIRVAFPVSYEATLPEWSMGPHGALLVWNERAFGGVAAFGRSANVLNVRHDTDFDGDGFPDGIMSVCALPDGSFALLARAHWADPPATTPPRAVAARLDRNGNTVAVRVLGNFTDDPFGVATGGACCDESGRAHFVWAASDGASYAGLGAEDW